jgi:preprotein translocase subunit SecD
MNFRLVIFILAIIFGLFLSAPSFLQTQKGAKINLGLDLQGGLYMLLGVKTDEAIKSKIKSIASSIKYFCEDEDIIIDSLKIDNNSVTFELLDKDLKNNLDKELKSIKGLDIKEDSLKYTIHLTKQEKIVVKEYAITQAIDTIRNRLDMFGMSEPTVAKQGRDKILVELPGIKTQEEEQRAREMISKAARLQMMAVDEERSDQIYSMSNQEAREYGNVILPDQYDKSKKYMLQEIPILDGSMLTDARVGFDQSNQPVINFTLNSEGAKIFGDFSGKNIDRRMAIVLDDIVYSAPYIRERIGGGSGQISGNFSVQEAGDVAIALRSGALLAPVELLEKRSVGPSLGADSIRQSLIALISGFILVVLFMIIYYGYTGIISNSALIANLFIIIAVMALFGATLTLPGMAGIVLTVGMAVDANVIINERIRELLKSGKSIKISIEHGYTNAMRAILDANITTLIAAILLYAYGTGPIKGFAITISIGILASMLTAILGTHGIYDYLVKNNKIDKKNLHRWFGLKVKV